MTKLEHVIHNLPAQHSWPHITNQAAISPHTSNVQYLAIEGGGMLGIGYLGMLMWMRSTGILSNLRGAVGTSAGGVFTALLALFKDSPTELIRIFVSTDWRAFRGKWRPWVPLCSDSGARLWVENVLRAAGYASDATLRDVVTQSGFDCRFAVIDRITGREQILLSKPRHERANFESLPAELLDASDWSFVDCILATKAIPIMWPRVRGKVDGGVTGNFQMDHAINAMASGDPLKVLGLKVDDQEEINQDLGVIIDAPFWFTRMVKGSIFGDMFWMANIARRHANRAHIEDEWWPRVIRADMGQIGWLDFGMDDVTKVEGVKRGLEACLGWERKHLSPSDIIEGQLPAAVPHVPHFTDKLPPTKS